MNGLLIINKSKEMTSFDVIREVRKKTGIKKIGHAGTLDPNAEGVLVLAFNRATKALNYLDIDDKVYHAKFKFGLRTDTGDIWGKTTEVESPKDLRNVNLKEIEKKFTGKRRQRVPMYSAKKIDGKKLYEYAREGKNFDTIYQDIEVYKLEIIRLETHEIEFKAHVSKGTYIRTLGEDIAAFLGNLAAMSYLVREKQGRFELKDAIELEALANKGNLSLLDIKNYIKYPRYKREDLSKMIAHGQSVELQTNDKKIFLDGGKYFGIYEKDKGNRYKVVRGLW